MLQRKRFLPALYLFDICSEGNNNQCTTRNSGSLLVSQLNWRILANLAKVVVDRGLEKQDFPAKISLKIIIMVQMTANQVQITANKVQITVNQWNKVQNQVMQYTSFTKNLPSFAE